MICERCEEEFQIGETYYETEEGYLCEICFDTYWDEEKKKLEREYEEDTSWVDNIVDEMRLNHEGF